MNIGMSLCAFDHRGFGVPHSRGKTCRHADLVRSYLCNRKHLLGRRGLQTFAGRLDKPDQSQRSLMTLDDIDFLIIGATKSATTWLQKSLQTDPRIAMPEPELHYFSREFDKGDDWYLAQFPRTRPASWPARNRIHTLESADAATRIASKLPKVKLLAQLRNPVERAYSDYCMMYRRGEIGRDVARYLDPGKPQNTRLISAGLYSRQLQAFYDRFPSDQILVTFSTTMTLRPEEHLTAVRNFLELPASQRPLRPDEGEGQNDSDGKPEIAPRAAPNKAYRRPVSRHGLFSARCTHYLGGNQLRAHAFGRSQAACRLLCPRCRSSWADDRHGLVSLAWGSSSLAGGRSGPRLMRCNVRDCAKSEPAEWFN